MTDPFAGLPNLGPQSRRWLCEAGIASRADLERLGPVAAYQLVKSCQPRATLNLLWSLAAGLNGQDWRELSAETKRELRRAIDEY